MRLFLFPLSVELKVFVSALENLGHKGSKSLVHELPVYDFKGLNFRCALGGHGKVQFAVQTSFFLNHFKDTSAVFCIGTAGSLGQVKPLDLVVATKTIEYDFNLKFIKRDKPVFNGDSKLIESFKKLKPKGFEIYFESVASGDEDVLDASRADEIKKETGAFAVAWEGAGGARACKFLSVPYLEVRVISDLANESAPVDFKNLVSKSMANLASLILSEVEF